MLQFFKSRKFKTFLTVVSALLVGAVLAVAVRSSSSPFTGAIGLVFSPLQKLSSVVYEKSEWLSARFRGAGTYLQEIERLEQKVAEYENRIVDYNEMEKKVESYEKMLGVKEKNKDYKLQRADVIGTDSADMYTSLIIDKGSNADISVNDPVVYGNYLIGIVGKVHPSYSVVETVLSPDLNISALESKTRETAYVTTNTEFSEKGQCIFSEDGQIVKKVEGDEDTVLSENAKISLYPEKFVVEYEGGTIVMDMDKIKQTSLSHKDAILIVDDKVFLDIRCRIPRSPNKYIAAWRYLNGKEYY